MIDLAEIQADTRAHRIADAVAEEVIRCNGVSTDTDVYWLEKAELSDFIFDCAMHLKYKGAAAVFTYDDFFEVVLGEFIPMIATATKVPEGESDNIALYTNTLKKTELKEKVHAAAFEVTYKDGHQSLVHHWSDGTEWGDLEIAKVRPLIYGDTPPAPQPDIADNLAATMKQLGEFLAVSYGAIEFDSTPLSQSLQNKMHKAFEAYEISIAEYDKMKGGSV